MEKMVAVLRAEERAVLSIRALYESHGYKKYKVSKFEEYGFFERHKNFLSGEHILSFTDLDGRLLALKPDITLSIIKHSRADNGYGERLYYLESIYRESAESGTFRETSQIGLEYLGPVDTFVSAETVQLAGDSLAAFDKPYLLELGHMGFVTGLLDDMQLDSDIYFEILRCLRANSPHELEVICRQGGLHDEERKALTHLSTLAGPFGETLAKAKGIVRNEQMEAALEELKKTADAAGDMAGGRLQVDLTMINDTRYYNGLLLAGYLEEVPRQVLAGGRYDYMMASLGKKTSGLGFAIYLDTLEDILAPSHEYDVDAVVLYGDQNRAADVLAAVDTLADSGYTVLPCRQIPPKLRYKKSYRVEEVASC